MKVTFAPTAPGARNGAVEIVDADGSILATTYVSGGGIGPLASFGPPVVRNIEAGYLLFVTGVAIDGKGNVFVADSEGNIRELLAVDGSLPSNPVVKYLPLGQGHSPGSLAIDGEGNLFFDDFQLPMNNLVELPAAGGYATAKIILTGIDAPAGVGVDGNGNVFAADGGNGTTVAPSVKELFAADNYSSAKTLGVGSQYRTIKSMALDSSGNIFLTTTIPTDIGAVSGDFEEILASSGYTTIRTISNALSTKGFTPAITADPAGNLFVTYNQGSEPCIR